MTPEEISLTRERTHGNMQRGIGHLAAGSFGAALAEFDAALESRSRWPWQEDAELAWMLSATWINRADALCGIVSDDGREEAVSSLVRGIGVLGRVPAGATPALGSRLVLAWIKLAGLHASLGDSPRAEEAYAEASERLAGESGENAAELGIMLFTNRSRFRIQEGRVEEALSDARQAVLLSRDREAAGSRDGLGISARAALAHALASLLEGADGIADPGWIAEATGAVDEAFGIASREAGYHPALADLLRYGARIHRVCQPQLLARFLTGALDRDRRLRRDASLMREMDAELLLARASVEAQLRGKTHESEVVAAHLETLRQLQEARSAIAAP